MTQDDETNSGGSPPTSGAVVDALVRNHRAFLTFLERRVGSRAEAEDLLQEAFARGLDKVATVRDDELAVAWFYRTLRNAVIDRSRRLGARASGLARFAAELATHDDAESEPELHESVCRCIAELAETLKPAYRDALQRIDIDGVAVKDYASETGISSSNAGVRVFRARAALRAQVAACCGSCADHGCIDCTCGASRGPRDAPA
ncbi:MAG: sigma-70 family RNA polymerase sigma factor [Polyangiales bacterium]